jgi:hypothetical protein
MIGRHEVSLRGGGESAGIGNGDDVLQEPKLQVL